jgi:hypothetical protein
MELKGGGERREKTFQLSLHCVNLWDMMAAQEWIMDSKVMVGQARQG